MCIALLTTCFLLYRDNKSNTPSETKKGISVIAYCPNDEYYNAAFRNILAMLEGSTPVSIKRAAFLIEWAYLQGRLDYKQFCNDISQTVRGLNSFIDQAGVRQYRTAGNYALFEYFTKPNWMNGNKPFSYDFEDFTGTDDYTKQFVTKVIRTHTGQCRSLPMCYKILAEEIGAEAYLAQAPNHLYIKHLGEDNKWVNVELTNGYQRLYGYNEFVILCCDKSLQYYPHNISALITKHNAARTIGLAYLDETGNMIDSTAKANHNRWRETAKRIEELGYRDMPEDNYLEWVTTMKTEKLKLQTEAYTETNH